VQLLSAADRARQDIANEWPTYARSEQERTLASARATLGADAFAAAWARGHSLTLEEAKALSADSATPSTAVPDARWLVTLLAKEMLTEDHTRWAQRIHSLLTHEGWACSRRPALDRRGHPLGRRARA
jgi:hypothetical protein